MKLFGRESSAERRAPKHGARGISCPRPLGAAKQSGDGSTLDPRLSAHAFTLVELILVLALLVVITSLVAPAMSNFIRGRALDSEARRLCALMHAGQSRAVSEGMPMMLWVDEKKGAYGLEAETPPRGGDPKAEDLPVDENVQISVLNVGTSGLTTFRNLPAIR